MLNSLIWFYSRLSRSHWPSTLLATDNLPDRNDPWWIVRTQLLGFLIVFGVEVLHWLVEHFSVFILRKDQTCNIECLLPSANPEVRSTAAVLDHHCVRVFARVMLQLWATASRVCLLDCIQLYVNALKWVFSLILLNFIRALEVICDLALFKADHALLFFFPEQPRR